MHGCTRLKIHTRESPCSIVPTHIRNILGHLQEQTLIWRPGGQRDGRRLTNPVCNRLQRFFAAHWVHDRAVRLQQTHLKQRGNHACHVTTLHNKPYITTEHPAVVCLVVGYKSLLFVSRVVYTRLVGRLVDCSHNDR